MAAVWRKSFLFGMFFGNSEFFKDSKIKNFDLGVIEAIEERIKNIRIKFQINGFIKIWDIVHANSKKVVSSLMFWDKFSAILLIEWYDIFTYF